MITDIKIQDDNYSLNGVKKLSGLSKINIFVGSNNSGKSRFLRSIFTNKLEYLVDDFDINIYNDIVNNLNIEKNNLPTPSVFHNHSLTSLGEFLLEGDNYLEGIISLKTKMENPSAYSSMVTSGFSSYGNNEQIGRRKLEFINNEISKINLDYKFNKYTKVYVPMLRGLRGFEEYTKDDINNIYDLRTQKDYFKDKDGFDIFTGLTLYEDIKGMLLGSLEDRELVKKFERFLSENFFENKEISLIPRQKDEKGEVNDVLFIKIGKEEERAIYNLGDGLQTIIINTFPLFKYEGRNLLLFIEEPEITIHPGMQRKLIEVYSSFENVQYFITTHSNHLLDITLDFDKNISTYSFKKENDEKYIIDNRTENKNILDMLGVRNSSVFLSNCIIWVEGISDRLYIKKFLELYYKSDSFNGKKYEEDKHYSILEYGGGNITHFNFDNGDEDENTTNMEAIQKNNFMVVDNDGKWDGNQFTNDEKGKRLKQLKDVFGDNIFLEHREIENILGEDLFKKYLTIEENGRLKYFKRKDLEYNDNSSSRINIYNNKIGEFIKRKFVKFKKGVEEPKYFKNNDITILDNNKANFARDIIKIIEEEDIKFENLDEIAQKMIKNIYKFIEENNI